MDNREGIGLYPDGLYCPDEYSPIPRRFGVEVKCYLQIIENQSSMKTRGLLQSDMAIIVIN